MNIHFWDGTVSIFLQREEVAAHSLLRSRLPREQVLEQKGGLQQNETRNKEEDDHGRHFGVLRETTAATLLM